MILALLLAAPFVHLESNQPLTAHPATPGLSVLAAPATRAYLAPLTKQLEALREQKQAPGCAGIALDIDVAGWLTELAMHPDGREKWIRVLSAAGLADAERFSACALPVKNGLDVRGKLTVKRFTGMLAALGAGEVSSVRATKEHYWALAAHVAWPEAFRAALQIDKTWSGARTSRIDAALGAGGTLLGVDLDKAFVHPLTGRFDVALVHADKRAARLVIAGSKSTADAARALQVAEANVPRASFDRPRQKNEWGFVLGLESLFVRLSGNELRASDAAFALALPEHAVASAAGPGTVVAVADLGRWRRLYERVGRVEDTRALVRDLHATAYVDAQKTPHPKALLAGIERCDLSVRRGDADVSFVLHCSRP